MLMKIFLTDAERGLLIQLIYDEIYKRGYSLFNCYGVVVTELIDAIRGEKSYDTPEEM